VDLSASEPSMRNELALERCHDLIEMYRKLKLRNLIAYKVSVIVAIVFSGLTPVLVLWSDLPEVLQALPAALAAIATGLSGIFQWKENLVRYGYTKEALESERAKYKTRATEQYGSEVDDPGALDKFVTRVEGIYMAELSDWRTSIQQASEKS
jgi:hypothetical protein